MMDFSKVAYERNNKKTIGSLIKSGTVEEQFNKLLDDLLEYLSEDFHDVVRRVAMGQEDREFLREKIEDWIIEKRVSGFERESLLKQLMDNLVGWGRLQELVEDQTVTDVFTNEKLEVIKRVSGEDIKTNIKFSSEKELESFIKSIMIRTGKRINYNNCIVSTDDPVQKIRINAGISGSPVRKEVVRFPYLVLRMYRVNNYEPEFFIENGTFSKEINDLFYRIALNSNICICGRPGAGKTTLIQYIMTVKQKIDSMRRGIIIEDTKELSYAAENSVWFETRKREENSDDSRNEYTMARFTREAARMAGKDIVIGEIRGAEAWDLYRMLALGYIGVYSVHGSSVRDGVTQTAFLMGLGAKNNSIELLEQKAAEVIDFVIYISSKKVLKIAEVDYDYDLKRIIYNDIFNLRESNGQFYWEQSELSDKYKQREKLQKMLKERGA